MEYEDNFDYEYEDDEEETKPGIGVLGILTIIFVILKLFGVIKWSWIGVLSPMILAVALGVVYTIIMYIQASKLK